jgi:cytochrome b
VPVWDALVRITHWSLAALVLWDWFEDSGGALHRNLGYLAAALVVLRLAWACVGPRPARFPDWWPTPSRLAAYLRELRRGKVPRRLGHNPLGALMMLALWSLVLALAVTGWMSRLDTFWGDDAIIELHGWLADALIALAGVHVIAVLVMGRLQGENLVAAMITGRKRGDGAGPRP